MELKICVKFPCLHALYYEDVKEYNEKVKTDSHIDSGFDLYTPVLMKTNYGETYKVDHGVSCAVYNKDGKPLGYYMYPRSSISKTPLRVSNCVGIIDSGYRGNLIGKLDHIKPQEEWKDYTVQPFSRLFQVCSPTLEPFSRIEIVETLDDTERGAGGFGSTGV